MTALDPWFVSNLVCPHDKHSLQLVSEQLVCPQGHSYPIYNGVPVMLPRDIAHTHIRHANETFSVVDGGQTRFGGETEKVDPFVQRELVNTNSLLYRSALGKLKDYPIPDLQLPAGNSQTLLDLGCNWGRWCIAASKLGYLTIGIDPSLEGILAANRIARQLGHDIKYVVADSRYLPFRDESLDFVHSYGVFQHFAKPDVRTTLKEVGRILKNSGQSRIQMINTFGLRSFYVQARRGFRETKAFETRYWTPSELLETFANLIGPSKLTVASFFTEGQPTDMQLFLWRHKVIVYTSEFLKAINNRIHILTNVADNLFVCSSKQSGAARLG